MGCNLWSQKLTNTFKHFYERQSKQQNPEYTAWNSAVCSGFSLWQNCAVSVWQATDLMVQIRLDGVEAPCPPVFSAARRKKLWIRPSGTPASESSSFKSSLDPLSFRFVYSILSYAGHLSGKSVSAPQPANAEAIRITHIASIVCRNDFIICSILSFDHRLFFKDYYTILA